MKKMLICLSMLLLMGAPTFAQSAAIDNFRNQIVNFLKVEGYVTSIDEEDKSVVFKNVFSDNLDALDGIKNKTAEYYNERQKSILKRPT